jgi:hypothetical protein
MVASKPAAQQPPVSKTHLPEATVAAGQPVQSWRVCGTGQARTVPLAGSSAAGPTGASATTAPTTEANRIVINGRDFTSEAEALLPLAAAIVNALNRKLEHTAGSGSSPGASVPAKGGAATPTNERATAGEGMEPCLILTMPSEAGKVSQDDVIRVRFVPAADGVPFDPQSLSVVGRRFGIERDVTESIRRRAKIDAHGMEIPLREVPAGRGTVTLSLRDQKQREVRFTQELDIRSAASQRTNQT